MSNCQHFMMLFDDLKLTKRKKFDSQKKIYALNRDSLDIFRMSIDDNECLFETNCGIKFTKVILQAGVEDDDETRVVEGAWCTVNCQNLCTSVKLDKEQVGFDLDCDRRVRIGYFITEINRILDMAIRKMCLNEVAEISFEVDENLIKPYKTANTEKRVYLDIKLKLHLISTDTSAAITKIYSLNERELIELAIEHKNEANELFKMNLIIVAFYRYQKSIRYLIIAESLIQGQQQQENNDELRQKIYELKAPLYLNIAACQLKYSNNSMNIIVNCTKCLELDKTNVKALYRRAIGYSQIKDYENSINDLRLAHQIDANNHQVKEKLEQFEELRKKQNEQLSSNLRKMFT